MVLLDSAMIFVSDFGVWVLAALVLLSRDRGIILQSLISFLVVFGLTGLLKVVVAVPRPFVVGDAQLVGVAPAGYGFPSQHAAFSFAFAASLVRKRVLGWVGLCFAVLIAYSRVYLGVHYWSDVIAGALIGAVVTFFVRFVMDKVGRQYLKRL